MRSSSQQAAALRQATTPPGHAASCCPKALAHRALCAAHRSVRAAPATRARAAAMAQHQGQGESRVEEVLQRARAMEQIIKPASDSRAYRYLRLPNGLRCLLVQDKDAVFAATCLSVMVGYMDDPLDLQGLAHWLEHAVHLGSERYPDEKEYKAYLSQHGGSSNASTGMVHTTFHFTVHSDALQGALDRLGAALAAPLLDREAVLREVENVHAEYSRNCNSDARKALQLGRALHGPGPYSQFSTGNISTLRDAPLQRGADVAGLMRALWEARYRADAMCGCVVAPQPLDTLEVWATQAFAGVRPGQAQEEPLLSPQDPAPAQAMPTASATPPQQNQEQAPGLAVRRYDAASAAVATAVEAQGGPRLVRISPQRDALRTLELTWHIPYGPGRDLGSKPWRLVGHLLGHEGRGSLTEALRSAGLVQELSAGMGDEVRAGEGFMFWGLTLSLTEKGLGHIPEVLLAAHRALGLVLGLSQEDRRRVHEEVAELAALRFHWADRTEPLALARDVAGRSHYFPPDQALSGGSLVGPYEAEALDRFLSHLVPSRLTVTITAQGAAGPKAAKEQWYGARHCVEPLPQELAAACAEAAGLPAPAPSAQQQNGSHQTAAQEPGHSSHSRNPSISTRVSLLSLGNGSAFNSSSNAEAEALALPELHMPGPNWALPVDTSLPEAAGKNRQGGTAPGAAGSQGAAATATATATAAVGGEGSEAPETGPGSAAQPPHPSMLLDSPQLRLWHLLDLTWGIPKVHLHLHLITPLVYASPQAWASARIAARLWEDAVQADAYPAALTGTSWGVRCLETGLSIHVEGFTSVAPRLLELVLKGLVQLGQDEATVAARYATAAGKVEQALRVWAHNNPAQHAEFAVEHFLQDPHWHPEDTLAALLGHGSSTAQKSSKGAQPSGQPLEAMVSTGSDHDNLDQAAAVNKEPSQQQPEAAAAAAAAAGGVPKYSAAVGPEAVSSFIRALPSQLYVELLSCGSATQQQAQQVAQMVRAVLQPQGLDSASAGAGPGTGAGAGEAAAVAAVGPNVHGSLTAWPSMHIRCMVSQAATAPAARAGSAAAGHTAGQAAPASEDPSAGKGAASPSQQGPGKRARLEQGLASYGHGQGPMESEGPGATTSGSSSSEGAKPVLLVPRNPNPSNSNSALFYLCQVCDEAGACAPGGSADGGAPDVKPSVLLELLAQIMSKPAFHALRTRQRLGYSVACTTHRLHGTAGLAIRIQSPDKAPALLRARVVAWLHDFRQELAELPSARLASLKAAHAHRLREPPRSLGDSTQRAWLHVRQRTYDFGRRLRKAAAVEAVTHEDLLHFYDHHLLPSAQLLSEAAAQGPAEGAGTGAEDAKAEAQGSGQELQVSGVVVEKASSSFSGCSRPVCVEWWGGSGPGPEVHEACAAWEVVRGGGSRGAGGGEVVLQVEQQSGQVSWFPARPPALAPAPAGMLVEGDGAAADVTLPN